MPKRIQLSRKKGWRMPENAVKVDRTTRWGNPFKGPNAKENVRDFRQHVMSRLESNLGYPLRELRGKDLACWCKPGAPCHADVLMELANREAV